MDPFLATLAGGTGTAAVALLVNQGWQQARNGMAAGGSTPIPQTIHGGVRLEARASGSARIYQSVGDQHITER